MTRSMLLLAAALSLLPSVSARVIRKAAPAGVPEYVIKYAPLSYLHPDDTYLPSSFAAQLAHTTPEVDFNPVDGAPSPLTLDNLDQLNGVGGSSIYLTSNDDVTTNPRWLNGIKPNGHGVTREVTNVVIVNDKGDGNVDAFYMYFYAFNYGGEVLGMNLGNHVGDWEHNMVRFYNGTPTALWYSQHSFGEAFSYGGLEKSGDRPINYVAKGTHANYATAGEHDHTIPGLNLPDGILLVDYCDKGQLYDSVANAYFYQYSAADDSFTAYADAAPVAHLNYDGQWGDQEYPDDDDRQHSFFGQPKYAGGPNGPKFKQLNRDDVCPDSDIPCIIRSHAGARA